MLDTPQNLSDQFLDRVRRSYALALALETGSHGTIWKSITDRQKPIHDALGSESNRELREIFRDPASTDLYYGVDTMCVSVLGPTYKEEWFASLVDTCRSDLFALAKATGFRREWVKSFHPPDWEEPHPSELNDEAFLQFLDLKLNQHIDFPAPFRGELGAKSTHRGTIGYRSIQAIYQTYRLLQILSACETRSVLEIGPGMGRTAFYAYRAGVHDYTTVDLPIGVVAQSVFLSAALSPDCITFYGEQGAPDKIKLLPIGAPLPLKVGIAINADSMTEMAKDAAMSYLNWMTHACRFFLSMNHEENEFSITELAREAFPQIQDIRTKYWVRDGYIEQLFYFPPAPPPPKRIREHAKDSWSSAKEALRLLSQHRFISL